MAAAAVAPGQLEIERVPCLSDNYSWLLHEPQQGVTAVVDPAEVAPVVAALEAKGWKLTHILNSEARLLLAPGSVTLAGPPAASMRHAVWVSWAACGTGRQLFCPGVRAPPTALAQARLASVPCMHCPRHRSSPPLGPRGRQ